MRVVHSDGCLLHNPQHEILSGKQVPYLESASRYLVIREALSQPAPNALPPRNSLPFEFIEANSWSSSEIEKYILTVKSWTKRRFSTLLKPYTHALYSSPRYIRPIT